MSEKTEKFSKIYDKYYKLLLVLPAILLLFSLGYMGYFYNQNGDFIKKDISLTGGTTLTLFPQEPLILSDLKAHLSDKLSDFAVRELSDFRTGEQIAIIVETPEDSETLKHILENYLNYSLDEENSSIEFTGSTLSSSFYSQLRFAIILSFVLMALVVFIIFRSPVPSGAVVLSAFADIIMTLATVNLLGMKVSSAGIIAFLMLIGYSVDTDIMLTTRLLKRKTHLDNNLFGAFKTGMTMTLTSLVAVSAALIITQSFSEILKQIFTILLIGLGFDILSTWITNASILKWYLEVRKK